MAVMVLVEVQAKPDRLAELQEHMRGGLGDTRSYDGCTGLTTYINQDDDCNMVLVEAWESRAQYDKYLAWRQETGFLDKITEMLASEPSIRFYDQSDL